MSDTRESSSVDMAMPQPVSGLAVAVNKTFSYASGPSLYCAMIPAYMKDYAYRYLLPAIQWLDGYVPYWHDGISGVMSTRLASRLITGVAKQVVGEKLLFEYASDQTKDDDDTLGFVSEWAGKQRIIKPVFSAVGWALAVGTSLIKINITNDQTIWWEAVRLDNSFYLTDFRGDVQEATFLIRNYTDTRRNHTGQFFLAEHRFYETRKDPEIELNESTGRTRVVHKKGERTPMVEYCVYRVNGTMQNNTMSTASMGESIPWGQLPFEIKETINKNYSAIRVGEPRKLGLSNLGVQILTNGNIDLGVPNGACLGESLIVPIESDLITYEYAYSCRVRDMYLGKGTVYMPKQMGMGDLGVTEVASGGLLSAMPEGPVETVTGVDPEKQKALVQQFDLRAEQWQKIIDDSLKAIAVKWGMSPKILASYLSQGTAQQTATQIDSEDDMSIAFISLCRSYFTDALNDLIETTMNFYGKAANVVMRFASPSLVNKDRILDRVTKELDEGLIDVEDAVRAMNPDLEEEALRVKIAKAKVLYEQNRQARNANVDPFDMGNLDGTGKI